jgi:hypothetical protein
MIIIRDHDEYSKDAVRVGDDVQGVEIRIQCELSYVAEWQLIAWMRDRQ